MASRKPATLPPLTLLPAQQTGRYACLLTTRPSISAPSAPVGGVVAGRAVAQASPARAGSLQGWLWRRALADAFERPIVRLGQGGSIPLVAAILDVAPAAEVILWGPEEPLTKIHGVDESVDLAELECCVLAETLFPARLGIRP